MNTRSLSCYVVLAVFESSHVVAYLFRLLFLSICDVFLSYQDAMRSVKLTQFVQALFD